MLAKFPDILFYLRFAESAIYHERSDLLLLYPNAPMQMGVRVRLYGRLRVRVCVYVSVGVCVRVCLGCDFQISQSPQPALNLD